MGNISIALLILLAIGYVLFNRKNRSGDSDMFIATQSESQARAERVLPSEGSEDMSHILQEDFHQEESEREERDEYLPGEQTEWIVTTSFTDVTIDPQQIQKLFDSHWRKEFPGATFYGKNSETGLWSYLYSADAAEQVTQLKIAWPYFASWNDNGVPDSVTYENRTASVRKRLNHLQDGVPLVFSKEIPEAVHRSEELAGLTEKVDHDAIIVLASDSGIPYSGKEIWDVMLSLNLQWGDMDLFHWNNSSDVGDDSYFSVWTTTQPGYFIPEYIAEGKVAVETLVFGYSIPRSAHPTDIFGKMHQAAAYAQKRLGGTLFNRRGDQFSISEEIAEIDAVVETLNKNGFVPGRDETLRQF